MANVDSIAVAPADPDPRSRPEPAPGRVDSPTAMSRARALVALAPAVLTDGAVLAFALLHSALPPGLPGGPAAVGDLPD
ncbi:hypothetical protein, partial [Micromonospora tarensis]|uniref:hypothetical protein n=1 Tax=Micromonospora tarensis TaxID=2806100 RepID=UPI001EE45D5A